MAGSNEDVGLLPASVQVERPELNELLDIATLHRICLVIGAAGWGKSTAVASWARGRRVSWLHADDYDTHTDTDQFLHDLVAALRPHLSAGAPDLSVTSSTGPRRIRSAVAAVVGWLRNSLREELVLVLDDLQWLQPDSDVTYLVENLSREVPDLLRVVLVSRREPPFSLERLRGQGLVGEVHAPELALDVAEVAALLHATVGEDPPGLSTQVWERTGGWPAALQSAVAMLRGVDPDQRLSVVTYLTRPGERFHGYLAEEVIGVEPEWIQELLRHLSVFEEFRSTTEITAGTVGATSALVDLARRGLVRHHSGDTGRWSLVQPLADYFSHEAVRSASERTRLHLMTAGMSIGRGAHVDALRHLLAAGDNKASASLLIDHGAARGNSGHADVVLQGAELPLEYLDDPQIQRVLGEARHVRGQWRPPGSAMTAPARTKTSSSPRLPGG